MSSGGTHLHNSLRTQKKNERNGNEYVPIQISEVISEKNRFEYIESLSNAGLD